MGIPCFYTNVLHGAGPTFPFIPQFYTWDFDSALEVGRVFTWVNIVFNTACTVTEMTFNIMSLMHVRKIRKQIQILNTDHLLKKEIKLLLQSFILGCIFIFAHIFFTVVFIVGEPSVGVTLAVQSVWFINHSVNPFVYLAINTRLRKHFVAVFKRTSYDI